MSRPRQRQQRSAREKPGRCEGVGGAGVVEPGGLAAGLVLQVREALTGGLEQDQAALHGAHFDASPRRPYGAVCGQYRVRTHEAAFFT